MLSAEILKNNIKYWWLPLLTGILSISLGLWCLLTPAATFAALALAFGISFTFKGVLEIVFSISNKNIIRSWGWSLMLGLIDLIFGILIISSPLVVASLTLAYLISFWLIFQSIWSIGISIEFLTYKIPGASLGLAAGIAGLIFALFLLKNPSFTGQLIAYLLSFSFIMYGVSRVFISFRLRSINKLFDKENR